ncbi:uncharacterized protein N7446_009090 [Penicillium canescens]|uniref:Uncharacterized protein n=1 Tax=Penicillium canescens TaxID=5083 RepID=A0AAD6N5L5_PENCN|nr:uncharacterized protein N7446_009090 [Penicillium canescens]KAJ6034341.1 hypothetical protein N7460_008516 [Penicillium canescens]KAJ6046003.1 hypothetical protein N7444_007257 [Penicillium canescens]KAJ6053078.1 hypothetical protein N7446_009090 [Penicillium canescens]
MAQSNPLSAVEVEHVPLLPEYPSTHQDGYAYIVNLRHMTLEEKGAALWGFQYCRKRESSPRAIYCSFLGCTVRNMFNTTKQRFLDLTSCVKINGTCEVVYKVHQHLDIHGKQIPYIACRNHNSKNPNEHFYQSFQFLRQVIDISLLEHLFKKGALDPDEHTDNNPSEFIEDRALPYEI